MKATAIFNLRKPREYLARPTWPMLLVFGFAALFANRQSAAAVPPGSGIAVPVPGGIARLEVGSCALAGQVVVTTGAGKHFKVAKQGRKIALEALSACPPSGEGAMAGQESGRRT